MSEHAVRGVVSDCASATDPGLDPAKQINEDAELVVETPLGLALILCDGMGGHVGGRQASTLAVRIIGDALGGADAAASPEQVLRDGIVTAGRRVYELGDSPDMPARPGSTVVVGVLHERGLSVAHVGDSRLYLLRAGRLYPLTRDHSLVQQLLDSGQLTPEQAKEHPDTNIITRALGMQPSVEVEVREQPVPLALGDVVLLASDGLTDLLRDDELEQVLGLHLATGLEAAAAALIRVANARGGHDNITVQLARVREQGTVMEAAAPAAKSPTAPTLVDGLTTTAQGAPPTVADLSTAVAPDPLERTTQPAFLPAGFGASAPRPPEWPSPEPPPGLVPPPGRALVWLLALAGLLVACLLAAVLGWWLYRLSHGSS